MRICRNCNKRYEAKITFCPECHKMLYPDLPSKSPSNKTHLAEGLRYEDWDPPTPETIYCKIKNIPYHLLKYNKGKGLHSLELRRISDYLEKKVYCCLTCSYYLGPECTLKGRDVFPKSICKSFEPKP